VKQGKQDHTDFKKIKHNFYFSTTLINQDASMQHIGVCQEKFFLIIQNQA